ncbi:hypothetical protein CU044_0668 [Streptomyces sp. L-9-10]|uniref:hypothetical protein n=1 Tax=Streptomyces sp. L-9-10 TaxID=1478131 RepID=UPI0010D1D86D|nr:hypothetical protein [Streptomyces sp. L-9-10]RYJ31025.1 hypothetical protein CU044_0668 [Streptomyces sp. L-9-10]
MFSQVCGRVFGPVFKSAITRPSFGRHSVFDSVLNLALTSVLTSVFNNALFNSAIRERR